MSKMFACCLTVVSLLLVPTGDLLAESEAAQRARVERETFQASLQAGLGRLAFLRGTRQMERTAFAPDGRAIPRPPVEFGVLAVNDGRQLHAAVNLDGYTYLMYWAYDPLLKRYTQVSMDSVSGLADIYHGDFDASGELVFTNLASGTHYQYLGKAYHNRLRFQPGADGALTLTVEYSTDRGATWTRQMQARGGAAR